MRNTRNVADEDRCAHFYDDNQVVVGENAQSDKGEIGNQHPIFIVQTPKRTESESPV